MAPGPAVGDVRVLICPGGSAEGSSSMIRGAQGKDAPYMTVGGELLEVNWYKDKYGAWFAGDRVVEDGGLYMGTPVDPLLVLLPVLEEQRGRTDSREGNFVDLDQILTGAPGLEGLREVLRSTLGCVCTKQEVGKNTYYRLDDARVLGWLCCKVEAMAAAIKVGGGQVFKAMGEADLVKYAVEMLQEYLPDQHIRQLREHYGVQATAAASRMAENLPRAVSRFDDLEEGPEAKKAKTAPSKAAQMEATRTKTKQIKNAQAAKGSMKLSSFFSKPKPPKA